MTYKTGISFKVGMETEIQKIKTIDCNQGAVRAVRYNVDGSYVLTCGSDKKLKLWNPVTAVLLKTYGGHGDEVTGEGFLEI